MLEIDLRLLEGSLLWYGIVSIFLYFLSAIKKVQYTQFITRNKFLKLWVVCIILVVMQIVCVIGMEIVKLHPLDAPGHLLHLRPCGRNAHDTSAVIDEDEQDSAAPQDLGEVGSGLSDDRCRRRAGGPTAARERAADSGRPILEAPGPEAGREIPPEAHGKANPSPQR